MAENYEYMIKFDYKNIKQGNVNFTWTAVVEAWNPRSYIFLQNLFADYHFVPLVFGVKTDTNSEHFKKLNCILCPFQCDPGSKSWPVRRPWLQREKTRFPPTHSITKHRCTVQLYESAHLRCIHFNMIDRLSSWLELNLETFASLLIHAIDLTGVVCIMTEGKSTDIDGRRKGMGWNQVNGM